MNKKFDKKFEIQESRYIFPYHHLVDFGEFSNYKVLSWGIEYYSYINRIIDIIKQINFNSLLDVGCGDGKLIFEIMKFSKDKKVMGVDLSEKAISFAKAFNYENGAQFYCGDLADIDIKEKFDIVTLIETLEHIPNEQIDKFIDSIYERLTDGGSLIISVPSDNLSVSAKHYRHYNEELLLRQFHKFKLKKTYYLIKNNMLYKFIIRISRKFCCFSIIRRALLCFSKKFLFNADRRNAAHITCVFVKGEE